jgi:RNA polymerase sigma-70 factor (ECF subfamily)
MIETDEVIYSRFLAERDEEDFRVLLERHKDSLILFLNGYVHNLEDAEELMLDAYAQAAAGTSFFSGKSSFKTWLYSIGKRMATTRLRRSRFFPTEHNELADETTAPPELDLLRDERNRELYLALRELNEEYRQILILLYFEQMTHAEAGRVMGKSRKQVYHLAERSRNALKKKLERMGFEYAQY